MKELLKFLRINNLKFHYDDLVQHPCVDLLETFEFTKEQLSKTPLPHITPFDPAGINEPVLVESKSSLIQLLKTLRNEREIGVDVITFTDIGNVVRRKTELEIRIISISTVDKDYMLDMKVIKNDVGLLNEIFLNPKIVKIFNRANEHLEYLQRLFCLYFVNIFDLSLACLVLFRCQGQSVVGFIKQKFGVTTTGFSFIKFFQRPMTLKTKECCTARVHHFIYIYNVFKNKFLDTDKKIYRQFLEECRKKPRTLDNEEFDFLEFKLKLQHENQLQTLKELSDWRAKTASQRKVDHEEVLDNKELLQLASAFPKRPSEVFKNSSKIRSEDNYILTQIITKIAHSSRQISQQKRYELLCKRIASNTIRSTQNKRPKLASDDNDLLRKRVAIDTVQRTQNKKPKTESDDVTTPPSMSTENKQPVMKIEKEQLEMKIDELLETVSQNNLPEAKHVVVDSTVSAKEEDTKIKPEEEKNSDNISNN